MSDQQEFTAQSLPSMKSIRSRLFKEIPITATTEFEDFLKAIPPKDRALLNRKSFKNQVKHLKREFNKRKPTTLIDPLA